MHTLMCNMQLLMCVYGINNYETGCSLHTHTFHMRVQIATTNPNVQFVCTHVKSWLQLMLCLFDWKLGQPGHCILECSDHTRLLEVSNSESRNIYPCFMNLLLHCKETDRFSSKFSWICIFGPFGPSWQ